MLKAILIDVDDTLLDFGACSKMAMTQVFQQMGHPLPDRLFEVFEEVNTALWLQIQRGELDLETLYAVRWNQIFEKLNLPLDGVEFERNFLKQLGESAIAVDGAYEMLGYLRGKYTVCIASNAPYDQQVKRLGKAEMLQYVQHLFISEKIGCEKPNSGFFAFCIQALQPIQPHEMMMLGDSISADILGAKNMGIKTCWYNHHQVPVEGETIGDYVITDLREVMEIV